MGTFLVFCHAKRPSQGFDVLLRGTVSELVVDHGFGHHVWGNESRLMVERRIHQRIQLVIGHQGGHHLPGMNPAR
jgi:hypothetical protein